MTGDPCTTTPKMIYELAVAIRVDKVFNNNVNLDAFLEKYAIYKSTTLQDGDDIVDTIGFGD